MLPKIKFYVINVIVTSIIIHILWIYEDEVDIFEGIWRTVVFFFMISILRKNHEQLVELSSIQKNIIFFLSLVTVVIGSLVYLLLLK